MHLFSFSLLLLDDFQDAKGEMLGFPVTVTQTAAYLPCHGRRRKAHKLQPAYWNERFEHFHGFIAAESHQAFPF